MLHTFLSVIIYLSYNSFQMLHGDVTNSMVSLTFTDLGEKI